jgi:hypothetical protein
MSIKISLGNKKKSFKSIKIAANAVGMDYMVLYMRLRMGMPLSEAVRKPVRKYTRQRSEERV